MNKFFKVVFDKFKFYLLGILIALNFHILTNCSKKSSPSEPIVDKPNNPAIEIKIQEGAKNIENAFKSGDVQKIGAALSEDAAKNYSDVLNKSSKDELTKIGEALTNRTLVIYTESYAEYKYTKDGQEYTIALARQIDGSWKLMRF